jgi:arabinofuranan 3-O-arabinosyltransferase
VSPEDDAPRTGLATSRLRMFGYAAILTAMAFSQSAGRMVADTKFDLLTNPVKFLSNGLRLWDPSAAFGQVQNQAYGYAWPMGPFFLLGDLVHLPPWVTQRLWWALLLCLAFFGVVRLAQKLALGSPLTQVLAGFAFVLTPRITTLLGGTSVEIWPMALAPWVLIPLVVGSERGSVRRAAAWSALAVACCGGVNAIAVAAVLPLGVIWILTRAAGPRKWPLLGWWTLFTMLATLWWSAPLVFVGRYSVPFLD